MRHLHVSPDAATTQERALFDHANAAALDGRYAEAKRILTQVWENAAHNSEIAGVAAWALGWVFVQEQDFTQAGNWFLRANLGAGLAGQTWPFIQTVLTRQCNENHVVKAITSSKPAGALPPLQIETLGSLKISRGGQALPSCHARKATAVLRYLLTRPQRRAHKDELAELLWPQAGTHEAAHSLHVAVAALRRYLGPSGAGYLIFDNSAYALAHDASIQYDADAFRDQLAAVERHRHTGNTHATVVALAGALACYTGDYYVDDRDGAWALAERERLLLEYLAALDQLGRLHYGQQRFADAAECFRLLLERDSYREDACAQLMQCFGALGRRSDALRAFEACRDVLRADLGLDPGDTLVAVWREVTS